MARKKRKVTTIFYDENINKYLVGVYVRLSSEDESFCGDTLENQKQLVMNFIEKNEDMSLIKIYEDNGKTGTNFNREAFKELIEDAKCGKINCIIVKDLSRLGRNHIEVGNYLENIFPILKIRFIAINDNFDSFDKNSGKSQLSFSFKNIVNEVYAKDTSKKVTSIILRKMEDGYFFGVPPYGYKKIDSTLEIDENVAFVVKKIFSLYINGKSIGEICRTLDKLFIVNPKTYRNENNLSYKSFVSDYKWRNNSIKRILQNEVYIGNLVHKKANIKVEKTHKAIIMDEDFYKVQKLMLKNKNEKPKLDKIKNINILSKKVFCKKCGKALKTSYYKNNIYYSCSVRGHKCYKGTYKFSDIEKVILKLLYLYLTYFIDENKFIKNMEKNLDKKISKVDILRKIKLLEDEKVNLYEKYCDDIVDKESYFDIKNDIVQKIKLLKIDMLNISDENENIERLKNLYNTKMLNRDIVTVFINKIMLSKNENGVIQIDVFCNFNVKNFGSYNEQ